MLLLRAESLAATHEIAATLASLARPGDVIVLAGDLGAGKTAFAQGFGHALGITEPITSPTFTLVHSHPVPGRRLTLHHADLYRLERTGDIDDLALHELAEFDGIVLIEWGDVAGGAIGDHLEVRLGIDRDDDAGFDDRAVPHQEAGFEDRAGPTDRSGPDVAAADDAAADDTAGVGAGVAAEVGGTADAGAVTGSSADDEFGLDEARVLELAAIGAAWAGRWDRLVAELAGFR